jgi:hypothetical protein
MTQQSQQLQSQLPQQLTQQLQQQLQQHFTLQIQQEFLGESWGWLDISSLAIGWPES